VMLGMTGAGKSSLLRALTNARVEVGDHLFATKEPIPGMLRFEDIQFQLIDTLPCSMERIGGSMGGATTELGEVCRWAADSA